MWSRGPLQLATPGGGRPPLQGHAKGLLALGVLRGTVPLAGGVGRAGQVISGDGVFLVCLASAMFNPGLCAWEWSDLGEGRAWLWGLEGLPFGQGCWLGKWHATTGPPSHGSVCVAHQGGIHGKISLTAYVVVALLETGVTSEVRGGVCGGGCRGRVLSSAGSLGRSQQATPAFCRGGFSL